MGPPAAPLPAREIAVRGGGAALTRLQLIDMRMQDPAYLLSGQLERFRDLCNSARLWDDDSIMGALLSGARPLRPRRQALRHRPLLTVLVKILIAIGLATTELQASPTLELEAYSRSMVCEESGERW